MKLLMNNGRVFEVNTSDVFLFTLPIPEDLEEESMTFLTEESEEESMGRYLQFVLKMIFHNSGVV